MPVIAPQHRWKDSDHVPLAEWPDDCYVQWGRSGVVMANGPKKSYRTAFFEAFPAAGGFIRGEGEDLAAAEASAFRRFERESACDHQWSRKNYLNGGAICRVCGGFKVAMKPVMILGDWRKPLSAMSLDLIAGGGCRPDLNDRSSHAHARRTWLRARLAGIDLPDFDSAPPAPAGFSEDNYARDCRKAVVAYLAASGTPKAPDQAGGVLQNVFEAMHARSLQQMLDDADMQEKP